MKKIIELQELAIFLRDAAYSDNQTHDLDWSLSIYCPSNNDGVIGYSGGIWHRGNIKREVRKSISFSYDSVKGISDFHMWENQKEIVCRFGKAPSFEEFTETVMMCFEIEKLYDSKHKMKNRQAAYDRARGEEKSVEITPTMLQEICRQMKIQDGKNIVALYTDNQYTDEQYIAVMDKLDDIQSSNSGNDEYEACKQVLGQNFEEEED